MIKLPQRPVQPSTLGESKVSDALQSLRDKVNRGEKPSSSKPNDFPSYWLPEARKTLWEHQNKKCCFCEREREEKRESDLEHYRPKAKVNDEPKHNGYWWLAYNWENYLFSCKPCNETYKGNQFPLMSAGQRAFQESDDLDLELPVLLDPYKDNPESAISFDWDSCNDLFVKAVNHPQHDTDERGRNTIEIVGLNRPGLPEERARILLTLKGYDTLMSYGLLKGNKVIIDQAAVHIKRETSSKKTFTGFRRAFFRKMGMEEYLSND
ncbi:MAG: hypothetical protein FVQ77_09570 [Cytophagales bacterium]|nr:hypothetical protein [Cytophagales bacterium]